MNKNSQDNFYCSVYNINKTINYIFRLEKLQIVEDVKYYYVLNLMKASRLLMKTYYKDIKNFGFPV